MAKKAKKVIKVKKNVKSNKKRLKKKSRKFIYKHEIKIDQLLLHHRQVFLSGTIDTESAHKITTSLIGLDMYARGEPIVLWINSRGGSVYDGFAIIDCINGLISPVMTIINGEACSMGGIISIFGKERYMTKNAVWMAHDLTSGAYDYISKAKYRIQNGLKLQSKVMQMFRDKTKLTEDDLEQVRHGELWLDATECKKKGIVDHILT